MFWAPTFASALALPPNSDFASIKLSDHYCLFHQQIQISIEASWKQLQTNTCPLGCSSQQHVFHDISFDHDSNPHICTCLYVVDTTYPFSGGHCEPIMLFMFNVTNILTAGTDSLIEALKRERIPRIIHQTWKTNVYQI